MGSYISVVNNTPDRWQCQLHYDEAAVKIAGITLAAISAVATTIATAGAAAPLAASLSANGIVSVLGVSTSAVATVTGAAAAVSGIANVVGGISDFSATVTGTITDSLSKDNYVVIEPGQKYRWGKKTLSLWQQAACVKTVNVDERSVQIETLYLRPIFTGKTANSENAYDIQSWLDSRPTEKQLIVAQIKKPQPEGRALEQRGADGNASVVTNSEPALALDKMYYFFANGTVTTGDAKDLNLRK